MCSSDLNAQGGDVVSGVATPHSIARDGSQASLQEAMPDVYDALLTSFRTLERHFGTVQDVEFTVERGKLWLLQTRPAVLSAAASVRVAVDMAAEQVISREEALRQADARQLTGLLHPAIAANAPRTLLARGLPASPGAATGPVVFSAEEAELRGKRGQRPVLVLTDTQPRDVHGLHAAQAVLTSRGGATSHAAVIARGLGRPCVVGASEIRVDAAARRFVTRGREVRAARDHRHLRARPMQADAEIRTDGARAEDRDFHGVFRKRLNAQPVLPFLPPDRRAGDGENERQQARQENKEGPCRPHAEAEMHRIADVQDALGHRIGARIVDAHDVGTSAAEADGHGRNRRLDAGSFHLEDRKSTRLNSSHT